MLKRLSVRALGPIEHADLEGAAPVTLLLGPNESGKTTLLEALQVLYFGTRGEVPVKENAVLTRAGSKGWTVEAEWDDETVMRATRSQRPTQGELQKKLGDPRVFRALGDLQAFLTADPKERKAMLADLSASDTIELAEAARKQGAPSDVVRLVKAGRVKAAQARVTELRREEGRKLRALDALAGEEVPCPEVETKQGQLAIDKVPLDKIEPGIARLSKRRDEIRQADMAVARWERETEEARAAQEELEDLQAESTWTGADDAQLRSIGNELAELRKQNQLAQVDIQAASELDQDLERLIRAGGDCPTCTSPIERDGPAWKAIHEARGACAKRITSGQEICKENAAAMPPLEKKLKALHDRRVASERLAAVRKRLEDKVARAGEIGEKPQVPAGDVEELSAEIARLNRMRDLRREWETRTADKQRAQARIDELKGPIEKLAALEKLLDPTAIGDEAAVLEEINGHLARTCGKLGVPVVLNDGYELSIHGRPVGLASDSARIRAGFGVACALAVLSGVGMAFLDRFESLDDSNRKRVLQLLKGLIDDGLLDRVWIAAVKENPVKVGNVPWLASVAVKDGTTTYLGE